MRANISPAMAGNQLLEASAIQASAPIIMALQECAEGLRDHALKLFAQVASGRLSQSELNATAALLAEILNPHADEQGQPGMELGEADRIAVSMFPDAGAAVKKMDAEEESFATALRNAMTERGMTQDQLAETVGIGQSAVSMMLNRQCRPRKATVLKFAKALGVTPDRLWAGARRYSFKELMAGVTEENIHPETDTGDPVGEELL